MDGMRFQRGVSSMLSLLVLTGLLMALLAWYTAWYAEQSARMYAMEAGRELSQVMSAVRSWIPTAASSLATLGHDPSKATGWITVGGLGFLRAPGCNPTSPTAFLPCQIANHGGRETLYGVDYTTEVNYTPTGGPMGAPFVVVRLHFKLPREIAKRPVMAALVAEAAAQTIQGPTDPSAHGPTIGSFVQFWANASEALVNGAPSDPAYFGQVNAEALNNASQDAWLRVDGTNKMLNQLNAGGFSVVNVADFEAAMNGYVGNSLIAGSDLASLSGNLIVGNHAGSSAYDPNAGDGLGEVYADNLQIRDMTLGDGKTNPRATQAIYDARMVAHNDFVPAPICPGNSAPQIFVAPTAVANDRTAYAMHAFDSEAVPVATGADGKVSRWQVRIKVLTSDPSGPPGGWENDPPSGANSVRRALVLTKCA